MSIPVAILGSGNIARDLYRKISRSRVMHLALVAGRNGIHEGLEEARQFSDEVSSESISAITNYNKDKIRIVFDTTAADAHKIHHPILVKAGIQSIDLTPSGCGKIIVPAVNIDQSIGCDDISLVSCGGQASIPMIFALTNAARDNGYIVDYVELTTSVSTLSAGPATRLNVDSYILHTEEAIRLFAGCPAKVILNINPADPPVNMQNSISLRIKGDQLDLPDWAKATKLIADKVNEYAPGWIIATQPYMIGDDRLFTSVVVTGHGDFLPAYSGNLDIITSAAVQVGEYILCQR
jgi:acetaldehyde dehydrogenase (acetylating)